MTSRKRVLRSSLGCDDDGGGKGGKVDNCLTTANFFFFSRWPACRCCEGRAMSARSEKWAGVGVVRCGTVRYSAQEGVCVCVCVRESGWARASDGPAGVVWCEHMCVCVPRRERVSCVWCGVGGLGRGGHVLGATLACPSQS